MSKSHTISSPGRICLFGEHQDYLELPVIPMAINKRLKLFAKVSFKAPGNIKIMSKQLKFTEEFKWDRVKKITDSPFKYIQAVFSYFQEYRYIDSIDEIIIDSEIPIGSGLSSSAALLVSTVYLVANKNLKLGLSAEEIAEIAYLCEREILGISCGRMDQYASAIGGIFHLSSGKNQQNTKLNLSKYAIFVIGDSKIQRMADTPLKSIQKLIFDGINKIKGLNLDNLSLPELQRKNLEKKYNRVLEGVIQVRENTKEAFKTLTMTKTDLEYVGKLLTEQHRYLSENYQVSHQIIDKMCKIALSKGALGAKMTGAGFGGSMFALTDEISTARRIKKGLEAYGEANITKISHGVSDS
ncbi:MAG: GHMP family kinase ATP-binding protein [Candidatus Hodarchaeales archaeon]